MEFLWQISPYFQVKWTWINAINPEKDDSIVLSTLQCAFCTIYLIIWGTEEESAKWDDTILLTKLPFTNLED